jgi:hypothetical protein
MRANLTADGTLTITPETPLEAYALSCWQAGQARRKGRTTLEIDASVATSGYITPWHTTVTGTIVSPLTVGAMTAHNGDCQ